MTDRTPSQSLRSRRSRRSIAPNDSKEGKDATNLNDSSVPSAISGSDDELSMETPVAAARPRRALRTPVAASSPSRARRASARKRSGSQDPSQDLNDGDGDDDDDAVSVQSRHSERKRKPPKWTENFVLTYDMPSLKRPQKRLHVRNSRKRKVDDYEEDDEEDEVDEGASQEAKEDGECPENSSPAASDGELHGANDDRSAEKPSNQRPAPETHKDPPYIRKFKSYLKTQKARSQTAVHVQSILERLSGRQPIPLKGLSEEYQTVHQLMEQTVVAGEGNSLLLIGSRGTGKTNIVETAITDLSRLYNDDFHVVRLNGFLHTDDRIALREIWRQLGREMKAADDFVGVHTYADTMASLLALLSHPEELYGASEDPNVVTTAKSVIIVLDEFDLFAHHARQTLLYNLFDIAQSRKAPLIVIGLTTKVEVTENLEKRVKSRFSSRSVFVTKPRSFKVFCEICKAGLLYRNEADTDSNEPALLAQRKNGSNVQQADNQWDNYVQHLFEDEDFQHKLQMIFCTTASPADFFSDAVFPLTKLFHSLKNTNLKAPIDVPNPKSFISLSSRDPAPFPFQPTTSSTSTTSLPLSLLLAATRLMAIHDPGINSSHSATTGPIALSFATVYSEYVRLITSAKVSASASGAAATAGRVWNKDVAREAWEKLAEWGLIVPAGLGHDTGDLRQFKMEVSFEEVLAELGEQGVGTLGRWWRQT